MSPEMVRMFVFVLLASVAAGDTFEKCFLCLVPQVCMNQFHNAVAQVKAEMKHVSDGL